MKKLLLAALCVHFGSAMATSQSAQPIESNQEDNLVGFAETWTSKIENLGQQLHECYDTIQTYNHSIEERDRQMLTAIKLCSAEFSRQLMDERYNFERAKQHEDERALRLKKELDNAYGAMENELHQHIQAVAAARKALNIPKSTE